MSSPWLSDRLITHTQQLLSSYQRWVGQPLLGPAETPAEQAEYLFEAPFIVLSHDTQSPPVFTYGNRRALTLFEVTWDELLQLPSHVSAEPLYREERAAILATVQAQGYVAGYTGVRVSTTGRRFQVTDGTIWTILDASDRPIGQAAVIPKYHYL